VSCSIKTGGGTCLSPQVGARSASVVRRKRKHGPPESCRRSRSAAFIHQSGSVCWRSRNSRRNKRHGGARVSRQQSGKRKGRSAQRSHRAAPRLRSHRDQVQRWQVVKSDCGQRGRPGRRGVRRTSSGRAGRHRGRARSSGGRRCGGGRSGGLKRGSRKLRGHIVQQGQAQRHGVRLQLRLAGCRGIDKTRSLHLSGSCQRG
jgi:hypothetical protein